MRAVAVLATLLVAACRGPAATPAPPRGTGPDPAVAAPTAATAARPEPSLHIDWATVPLASDDDALALWRRLDLTGDSWLDRLSLLPETGPVREALARALLRHGGFVCERVDTVLGCGQVESEIREPTAADGFDSPCLRRLLALWALEELDDETLIGDLEADLVAIAGLPAPEGELNRAALQRVHHDEPLLKMIAAAKHAGNHAIADEGARQLSDHGLAVAGIELHVDGALEVADVGVSLPLYLHALADPALRPATRSRVAQDLGGLAARLEPRDPERVKVVRALTASATAGDCALAGHAADQLAAIGVAVPAAPAARDRARLLWATCRLAARARPEPAAWKPLIGASGLVIKRHVEPAPLRPAGPDDDDPPGPDPDDEGHPVERIPLDAGFELPFADELIRALPGCAAAECPVPGTGVSFRVGTRKGPGGRLVVETIERFERPAC